MQERTVVAAQLVDGVSVGSDYALTKVVLLVGQPEHLTLLEPEEARALAGALCMMADLLTMAPTLQN